MPTSQKDITRQIPAVISLFDGDFSIDWIISLTQQKPSRILGILESAVEAGWLGRSGIGRFHVTDPAKKEQLQSTMALSEKEYFFGKIAGIFLSEVAENNLDITQAAAFLLKIKNDAAGCRGLMAAGDAYVKNYQPDRALACYEKLRQDLPALSGEAMDALFIEMAIKYSKVSTARQSTTEVVRTLKMALDRAVGKKDQAAEALILMHIAKNEWLLNRYDKALKTFRKGWRLARQCDDPKLMRSAVSFKIFFSFWQGRYREVIDYYENTLSDVEKSPQSGFPLLVTITVGQCYTHVGQITQGVGLLDALQASCREAGDFHTAAFATASINTAFLMVRSTDETLAYVEQSYADIRESGNLYVELLTQGALAYLHYLKGNVSRSVFFLKKFVTRCRDLNIDTLHHRPYVLELCWAMEQGRYPRILDLSLEKEVTSLIAGQNVYLKGLAYRYRALLDTQKSRPPSGIMKSLAMSLKWLEISGHELEILTTRMEMLRRYLLVGDREKSEVLAGRISSGLSQYHKDLIPADLRPVIKGPMSHQNILKDILQLGTDITDMSEDRDLIQKILSTVNHLTGAERGAIFVKDPKGSPEGFVLRASKNLTHEEVGDDRFAPSMDLVASVAAGKDGLKPVIRNDSGFFDRGRGFSGDVIRSCICAPIILKGRVMGVLYHDNRLLQSAFQSADIEWLSFFAAQAALALDCADAHLEIDRLQRKMARENQYAAPPGPAAAAGVRFDGIIGQSAAIREMLYLVEKVAKTDTHVLITGETGVGKELVANALHDASLRHHRPFIKANCSALTETLINSELFGHERGAFTGADSRRIGRFELASDGTLFLDEIGDLPLGVQANLLRVLQSAEFERVGGNTTIRSDFRLIAATNRDLAQQVEEKKFRADLYFRLNVFPIRVPPLRERKEDIPLLVQHFIHQSAGRLKKVIRKVPAEEMSKLMVYDWPGNVRELENAIERAMVINETGVFKAGDFQMHSQERDKEATGHTLVEMERNHILWALSHKGWKVRGPGGVAEFLDIHPSTLAARMKKLGIQRPEKGVGED